MSEDLEDPGVGEMADEPARRRPLVDEDDEAEEAAEGEEKEDAGDGEDEGPGEDLQDSSEEEEGEGNEYDVTDKFLVADDDAEDDEEGGEGDAAAKRKKKRRRRREEDEELDEEDYELIGQRPPRKGEHKRIRKLTQPGPGRQHVSAEDIREELFGKDNDDDDLQDVDEEEAAAQRRAERQRREEELDDLDEDEFADFLVDDEEGEKPGEPRRRRRALAKALPTGVSAEAFQEAQDIFGDADELLEEFRTRPRFGQQEPLDEEEDMDAEDLGDDEEARAERLRAIEERRKAREMKKITEKVEPEMLARAMLRSEDDVIRTTDLPEREQLKPSLDPRGWKDPDSKMLDDCAAWIYKRLLLPEDNMAEEENDNYKARALRQAQPLETQLLLTGRREVDGPSESGSGLYPPDVLISNVNDLSRGQRAVRDARSYTSVVTWRKDESEQDALRNSIKAFLTEVFDRHNEVPFLALYRKQGLGDLLCGRAADMPDVIKRDDSSRLPTGLDIGMVQAKHRCIRRWDILWKVYDLAVQWRALARRQEAREAAYRKTMERPEATEADEQGIDGLLEMLRAAESAEAIADIEAKYRLRMAASSGRLEEAMETVTLHDGRRRPSRRSTYENLLKAGLEPVVRQIYMTAETFAESLDYNYRRGEVDDIPNEPREFAAQYINPESGLATPESVLTRAAEMAICELVAEPQVRKAVREPFLRKALVSTEPTPQGEQLLDPFHICGRVKRLRDKPVQSFVGSDTFLRITQAEKEGLIEVRTAMDAQALDEEIIQPMVKLYKSQNTNRLSQAWNAIRADTLRKAIMDKLLPSFAAELRSKLIAEAQEAVLQEVSDKLWGWASQAPTQVTTTDDNTVIEQRKFAAVCWGPGDPATTMVMLNEHGQLVDVLYAGQLSGNIRRTRRNAQGSEDIFSDPAKSKDAERIRDFLVQHTPHKIFVGGSCMQCTQLYEDLDKVLEDILGNMPSAFTRSETGYIQHTWADESLAALWETSEAAMQEMNDQLPLVRRAIALGRSKLEPLAVLSALCGPSAEILSADLHPLKELLPKQALLTAAERVCITAVNQVGLDINIVAHSAWQTAPLQFIAGLGPRKAQLLARTVQSEDFVGSRVALYRNLGVMDKVVFRNLGVMDQDVFRNCGGSLRITASNDEIEEGTLDPLDATRISPTQYTLAKELARAIVGAEDDPEDDYLLQAQDRPMDVEGFNLHEYNKQLQETGKDDQLTAMREITFELAAPAGELRRQRDTIQTTEVFYMLCGESSESLKEGREVSAVVTFAGSRDVLVRLPDFGDAEGVIPELAEDHAYPGQPRDRFVRDQPIRVRINALIPSASKSVISKLSVHLVNEEDNNSNDEWEQRYCQEIDPWYHILTREEHDKALAEKRRATKGRQLIHRPIRHPYFKNLTALQTAEALRDSDVGACLFTPSSRSTDQIKMTIKVHKRTDDGLISDIYYAQDVIEGPKGSAVGAHLKLGKPLEISFLGANGGFERYEDLDEIIARFVEPYVAQLKQIKGHRKYREGHWEHVQAQLVQTKKNLGLKGAAYVLGAKQESPGVFYLACITNIHPHREYMTITPDGIYYRHEVRKDIEHVLHVFKKNPWGDRAAMHAEPAPPPPQVPRVNRWSAQPPAGPPGPPMDPPGMPPGRPSAVQGIKPAWLTVPQQPQPQGQMWPPARPAPPGNGYAQDPPPPPPQQYIPQQPIQGYSQAYGQR